MLEIGDLCDHVRGEAEAARPDEDEWATEIGALVEERIDQCYAFAQGRHAQDLQQAGEEALLRRNAVVYSAEGVELTPAGGQQLDREGRSGR